jgi:hypothetical protein
VRWDTNLLCAQLSLLLLIPWHPRVLGLDVLQQPRGRCISLFQFPFSEATPSLQTRTMARAMGAAYLVVPGSAPGDAHDEFPVIQVGFELQVVTRIVVGHRSENIPPRVLRDNFLCGAQLARVQGGGAGRTLRTIIAGKAGKKLL